MGTITHISMRSPLTQHSRMKKKKKSCLFVFVFFLLSLAMCYKSVKWTRNACNPRPYTVHDINERLTKRICAFVLEQREYEEEDERNSRTSPNIRLRSSHKKSLGKQCQVLTNQVFFIHCPFQSIKKLSSGCRWGVFTSIVRYWPVGIMCIIFLFCCSIVTLLCL